MSEQHDLGRTQAKRPYYLSIWSMVVGIGALVYMPQLAESQAMLQLAGLAAMVITIYIAVMSLRQKSLSSIILASIGLIASTIAHLPLVGVCNVIPCTSYQRSSTKLGNCLSNSRQIGLALRLYSDDYDGRWPPASNWHPLVNGYIKNRSDEPDVFQCPSAAEKKYSYGMNINTSGIAELTITNPATTVAVFDCSMPLFNAFGGRDAVDFRHLKGSAKLANITFTDGHAMAVNSTKAKITNAMSIDQVRWKP